MSNLITTRALRADDYDAVVELWLRSDGVEVAEGDDRATIAAYLERNPGLSRVALSADRIVGAVLCGHDGRRGLIYHLAVASEQRGRGIGRRLVDECIQGLRTSGIKRALVFVTRENARGRDFWLSGGFEALPDAAPLAIDIG